MGVAGLLATHPGHRASSIFLGGWLVRPTPLIAALEIFPQTTFLTAVMLRCVMGLFIERRLHAEDEQRRACRIRA